LITLSRAGLVTGWKRQFWNIISPGIIGRCCFSVMNDNTLVKIFIFQNLKCIKLNQLITWGHAGR